MADLLSRPPRTWVKATDRAAVAVDRIGFRLRLLRLATRRIDNIPAAVIMSIEEPVYELPRRAESPSELRVRPR